MIPFLADVSTMTQLEIFGRLALAGGLGAVVGIEREFRGHEAGLRTTALVALGAALFGETSTIYGDSRIAAGVVQGIGFLGAGLIITQGLSIKNATTATTMWAMAGVGLAAAEELWLVAVLVTALIILLLEAAPISDWVFRKGGDAGAHWAEGADSDLDDEAADGKTGDEKADEDRRKSEGSP